MKLNFIGGVAGILLLAALIVAYSSLFTVYQTQQALVVRLGQVVRVVDEPGLHVKLPFIENVIDIDKRILDLEAPAQEVIASDQKRLVVDAFARYRIKDALRFYQSIGTIQAGIAEHSIYAHAMAGTAVAIFLIAILVNLQGWERRGITFGEAETT